MQKVSKIFKQIFNYKYIEYIFLSFVLILGLLLRLYKINNPIADWHSWRQADTSSVTRSYVDKGINLLFPRYHDISTTQTGKFNPEGYRFVEFPIYNVVHTLLTENFNFLTLEVWGRLLSVFFALVTTVFIYLLGKRFLGVWGGILASFFYVVLPYNIYFTRVILPEPMAVMFAVASLWAFITYIDSNKNWRLYFSGLLFALALLVKPYVIFYSVPMIYLLLNKFKIKEIFRNAKLIIPLLLFTDIVLVPLIAWRGWISNYPEGIPHFGWVFNGDDIRFKPSFWSWIFGERLSWLILGGWGLVPFSFGLMKRLKNSYFTHFFLLGMFFYVSVVATANVRHDYYQTLVIPAVSLILAQGCIILWESSQFNKLLSRGLLVFSIGLAINNGLIKIKEFYKINHPEIIIAGQSVDRLTPKNALVIAPYNGDSAFLYQTKRWGWPFVDRPIEELIENGADYYVSVNFDAQTNEFINKFETVQKKDQYLILSLQKRK